MKLDRLARFAAAFAPEAAQPGRRHSNALLHLFFSFGLLGLFAVAVVDASFIPLPLPGITDIMIIVMAAQHHNWLLLIPIATAGSALGGYLSYQVGHSGGVAFMERRLSAATAKRIRDWMERHAILSVALPALLPPPMPLSPFVLAAGAIHMERKQFLTTFTISRAVRHTIAVWLGFHYGRHILHLWNRLSAQYAHPILIAIWTIIALSCALGVWRLYRASRASGAYPASHPNTTVS
ncbi:hypothetical protein GCM10011507_15160 [Edaphobacter acidisoli]|uniref:VTT domain-containing protein n=1 Tax=Edaphobacter acidisoli TaxID=2040573 RepID=A0A916RSI9_9BACT|nr:VTT domain-containing protein [Edaphobacter acidisoli]GGA64513.1 hypothetical protein GCM10011507_15160 [Edaphobacter acidisoli]